MFEDPDEAKEFAADEAQRREAREPIGTGYSRFIVGYQTVLAILLLALALVLAVSGETDTAVLLVALAGVAGLWGLVHRRYTRR
jgi:hypothetical protein